MKAIIVGGGIMGLSDRLGAGARRPRGRAVRAGPAAQPARLVDGRASSHPSSLRRSGGLCPHDRRCLCRLGPAVGRSRPALLRRHRHAGAHRQRRRLGRALGRGAGDDRQADDRVAAWPTCRVAFHKSTPGASNAPSGSSRAASCSPRTSSPRLPGTSRASRASRCIRTRPSARSTSSRAASSPRPAPHTPPTSSWSLPAPGSAACCPTADDAGPVAPGRHLLRPAGRGSAPPGPRGPMVIEKTGDVGLYLVPPMEGRGLKVGDHEFSRAGDPDGRTRRERGRHPPPAANAAAACCAASSAGAPTG